MGLAAWIWAALATLGALAAAWARIRAGNGETTVSVWRDEASAWRAKAERLEQAIAELTQRVDRLEAENRVLRTIADPRADMAALRSTLEHGFADLRALLGREDGAR